jgi:hypothetical protein
MERGKGQRDKEGATKWEETGKVGRYGETGNTGENETGTQTRERESRERGGRQIGNEENTRPRTVPRDIEKGRKDAGTGNQREGSRVGGYRETESKRVREKTRKDREKERPRGQGEGTESQSSHQKRQSDTYKQGKGE